MRDMSDAGWSRASRYRDVPFSFIDATGQQHVVRAEDASPTAARFKLEDRPTIEDCREAVCLLGGSEYVVTDAKVEEVRKEDDDEALLVTYTATEARRRTAAAPRLYRSTPWWARPFRILTWVSKIHLYEAQERYVYLRGLVALREVVDDEAARDDARAVIRLCRAKLDDIRVLLTRNQQDLNFLWRELTFVHVALLEVLPSDRLPSQLDFCREEVRRLALSGNVEIRNLIERLADAMDTSGENETEKRRLLRALLERFNSIRTGRIHQQLVNIRCYQFALAMLVVLTGLMIGLNDTLVTTQPVPVAPSVNLWGVVLSTLAANSVAFAFFAGFVGGLFSTIIRLRSREMVPGEDAYFLWYALTKPCVGGLAASITLLLLLSGIVSLSGVSDGLLADLESGRPSVRLFALAFAAGFSERFVLPTLSPGRAEPTPRA